MYPYAWQSNEASAGEKSYPRVSGASSSMLSPGNDFGFLCQILDIMYYLFSTAVSGVGSSPALATCENKTNSACGCACGFHGVLSFLPTYRLARLYEWNNLERDIKLNKKSS